MRKVSLVRKDGAGVALGLCDEEGKVIKVFGRFSPFENTDEYAKSKYDVIYDDGKRYFQELASLDLPPLYRHWDR